MQDVINAIKNGKIEDEPELDIKLNQWKYRVRGKTTEEKPLSVIVAIEDDINILITCVRG